MTFEEYSRIFIQRSEKAHAEKTTCRYIELLVKINAGIGHIPLKNLTSYHIGKFYDTLKEIDNYSNTTIHHYYELISVVCGEAVRDKILTENLADSKHMHVPKRYRTEALYLSEVELRRVVAVMLHEEFKWRIAVLILTFTGIRREELMGLEWKDFNFEKGWLLVQRASSYTTRLGIFTKIPKTARSKRYIPLTDFIISKLLQYRKIWEDKRRFKNWFNQVEIRYEDGKIELEKPDRLFTKSDGSPMHPDTISDKFKKISQQCGVYFNVRMFRHTFASRLVEGNLPINNVSDLLGHSQISTTLDVYTHRFKENNLEKLEHLEGIFKV